MLLKNLGKIMNNRIQTKQEVEKPWNEMLKPTLGQRNMKYYIILFANTIMFTKNKG